MAETINDEQFIQMLDTKIEQLKEEKTKLAPIVVLYGRMEKQLALLHQVKQSFKENEDV